ncbi:MAG: hypothetical protein ACYC4L_04720 [Chloroflexota bacterium]
MRTAQPSLFDPKPADDLTADEAYANAAHLPCDYCRRPNAEYWYYKWDYEFRDCSAIGGVCQQCMGPARPPGAVAHRLGVHYYSLAELRERKKGNNG